MERVARLRCRKPRRNIVAGEPVKRRVRMLDGILRPWFTHGPHHGMAVLTTIGRRTGEARRHCVRAIRQGNRVYLVSISGSHSSWFLNATATPEVRLHLRGQDFEGTIRQPQDEAERMLARSAYVGTVNRADYVECFIHWRGRPSRLKIQRLHEMWFEGGIPLVIELRAPSDDPSPRKD